MRKIFKHIIVLFTFAALFSGCSVNELDLNPPSAIGDNAFYTNTEEVESAVIAIYDGWQAVPLREFAITEMRSGNTRSKSREGDWAQFESFEVKPTNLAVGTYWKVNYNVIFRANRVLENLDAVTDPDLKLQFQGEAKFSRALAHFNLVRAYGGVPILDKVIIQTNEDYFSRDPESEVYAFIENDFKDAAALLPNKSMMPFGRATSGAASALLAKVLLTQHKYTEADAILSSLISSAEYSLMPEYNDVFYKERNNEIVFGIPYNNDDTNESQDFSFEMTAGGRVSGLNYITADFLSNLDPLEVERSATLISPKVSLEVGKFITSSADARLCGNDWIVIRWADVLLMKAEAIMAGNSSTSSLTAINVYNQTRERAGMSTLAVDGSATLSVDQLLLERRIELAFENHRLYDLIRFNKAEAILGAYATATGYTFSATDLLLPIPQSEINVSNKLLTQNPGY